jgi:hypothetical protein
MSLVFAWLAADIASAAAVAGLKFRVHRAFGLKPGLAWTISLAKTLLRQNRASGAQHLQLNDGIAHYTPTSGPIASRWPNFQRYRNGFRPSPAARRLLRRNRDRDRSIQALVRLHLQPNPRRARQPNE